MNQISVTYEFPSANNISVQHTYICNTAEQAEHVCKMVEERKDIGYKLIDVSAYIDPTVLDD